MEKTEEPEGGVSKMFEPAGLAQERALQYCRFQF